MKGLRIAAFLLFNVVGLSVLLVMSWFVPRSLWLRASSVWGKGSLFLLGVRYRVVGEEYLIHRSEGETVYAAMHTSLLDTFLFPAILPWSTVYVAKDSLRTYPLLGVLLRRAGHLFVRRDGSGADAKRFLRSVAGLARGTPLFIHPDGTRQPEGVQRGRHAGFVFAARLRKARIVPIASHGGFELWPRGAWFPRSGEVTLVVGSPWPEREVQSQTMEELCDRYVLHCDLGLRQHLCRG